MTRNEEIRHDPGAELAEYKLSETATFSFCGDAVVSREPARGTEAHLPLRLFPLVRHFARWQPMYSAFLVTIEDGQIDYPEVFCLLRELVESGILVSRCVDKIGPPSAGHSKIWSWWGAALLYYLDSRTFDDQPYYGTDEVEGVLVARARTRRQPSSFKDYAACPFIALEEPRACLERAARNDRFLDVLLRRRTCRAYTGDPLTRADLSTLLHLTWGATRTTRNDVGEDVFLKKTSPSGGSLHGAEVYPIVMNVEGLESGIYHYSVRRHGLELLSREDPRAWIADASGGQAWIADAAAAFLTTSMLERTAWKYQLSRALRVVLLDIGHLSQTFYLVATSLGLGAFATAALRDESFERKLGLDYLDEPVFLLNGAGHPDHHPGGCDRPRRR